MRGSIEKRGKDSYRLTVYGENDGKGNYNEARHRKTVHAINKTEAEEELTKFMYEVQTGQYMNMENLLFRDLVKDWYKNHLFGKSPRTIEGYESNIRLRIMPSFGHLPLNKIKKTRIIAFFDKLKQPGCEFNSIVTNPDVKNPTGNYFTSTDENDFIHEQKKYNLSAKTIDNHKICMNSIFSYAVYKEYIKESPMKGVKTPKAERQRPVIAEKNDLKAIFQALKNEPLLWQSIVLFALVTGAREGEIAALRKDHIDLDNGVALIDQAAVRVKGKGILIKSTKSGRERGNRLPNEILPTLREYDSNRIDENNEFFFVPEIYTTEKRGFRPENIGQHWRRFLDRYKLKHVRFHDLRHISVALSIEAGDEMKAISERVGHSSIDITADRYGFLFKNAATRSAEILGGEIKKLLSPDK